MDTRLLFPEELVRHLLTLWMVAMKYQHTSLNYVKGKERREEEEALLHVHVLVMYFNVAFM